MMFDDLDFKDEVEGNNDHSHVEAKPTWKNKSGGFKKFEKTPEVETDLGYVPITFFVDQSFPQEIKDKFKKYISLLLNKNYIVRVNADDKDFINSIKGLSDTRLELYTAWKSFNEVETKHYFNTNTSKLIAAKFSPAWDKVPDVVKAFLARNARLVFGDKNNSCTLAVVTWSEDGATKTLEIGKATGKAQHIIRMAAYYSIPIFNLQKSSAETALTKVFDLL